MASLAIKLKYNDEIRKVSLTENTYEQLIKVVKTTYPTVERFKLSYIDGDADLITIGSTEELNEAYAANKTSFKVLVSDVGSARPVAPALPQPETKPAATEASKPVLPAAVPAPSTPKETKKDDDDMYEPAAPAPKREAKEEEKKVESPQDIIARLLCDTQLVQNLQRTLSSADLTTVITTLASAYLNRANGELLPQIFMQLHTLHSIFESVLVENPALQQAVGEISQACMHNFLTGQAENWMGGCAREAEEVEEKEQPVHWGVACDGCNPRLENPEGSDSGGYIKGIRYKSLSLPDYDLCQKCLESGKFDKNGPFRTIEEPVNHHMFGRGGRRCGNGGNWRNRQRGHCGPRGPFAGFGPFGGFGGHRNHHERPGHGPHSDPHCGPHHAGPPHCPPPHAVPHCGPPHPHGVPPVPHGVPGLAQVFSPFLQHLGGGPQGRGCRGNRQANFKNTLFESMSEFAGIVGNELKKAEYDEAAAMAEAVRQSIQESLKEKKDGPSAPAASEEKKEEAEKPQEEVAKPSFSPADEAGDWERIDESSSNNKNQEDPFLKWRDAMKVLESIGLNDDVEKNLAILEEENGDLERTVARIISMRA